MALRKVFSLSILVISLFCSCKPEACECDIVWKREEGGLGLLVAEENTLKTCKIFYDREQAGKICAYIEKSYEEEQKKPKKSVKEKSTVMYLDDALSRMSNRLEGKGIVLSAFELEKQNKFIVHVFQVVPLGDGGEMAIIDFDGDGKDIKTQTLGVLPAIEALQKIGYVLKEKIMN